MISLSWFYEGQTSSRLLPLPFFPITSYLRPKSRIGSIAAMTIAICLLITASAASGVG
jgi:hypothetical protein